MKAILSYFGVGIALSAVIACSNQSHLDFAASEESSNMIRLATAPVFCKVHTGIPTEPGVAEYPTDIIECIDDPFGLTVDSKDVEEAYFKIKKQIFQTSISGQISKYPAVPCGDSKILCAQKSEVNASPIFGIPVNASYRFEDIGAKEVVSIQLDWAGKIYTRTFTRYVTNNIALGTGWMNDMLQLPRLISMPKQVSTNSNGVAEFEFSVYYPINTFKVSASIMLSNNADVQYDRSGVLPQVTEAKIGKYFLYNAELPVISCRQSQKKLTVNLFGYGRVRIIAPEIELYVPVIPGKSCKPIESDFIPSPWHDDKK